jgi:hypothetical protein
MVLRNNDSCERVGGSIVHWIFFSFLILEERRAEDREKKRSRFEIDGALPATAEAIVEMHALSVKIDSGESRPKMGEAMTSRPRRRAKVTVEVTVKPLQAEDGALR